MDEQTNGHMDTTPVDRLDILFLIRSYNRKEITLDEWLKLSREWAERMIGQAGTAEQCRVDIKSRGRGTDEVC